MKLFKVTSIKAKLPNSDSNALQNFSSESYQKPD